MRLFTTIGQIILSAFLPFMVVVAATMILAIFVRCAQPTPDWHDESLISGGAPDPVTEG